MHINKSAALAAVFTLGMVSSGKAQTAHPDQPLGAEDRLGGAPSSSMPSATQDKTPATGTPSSKGRSSNNVSPAAPLGAAGESTQPGMSK